jgi:amino acid adenylation domain-containing protein
LSQRQTLMWFDEQITPGAPLHRLVLRATLRGPLDVERLRSAWATTTAGYDSLGLQIDAQDLRQTWSCPDLELPVISVLDKAAAHAWAEEGARSPWPSTQRWKAALLEWSPDAHLLFFCCSHLLADGQSVFALLEQLVRSYRGEPPVTAPSFAEFIKAEADYLASPKAQTDAEFWTSQLSPSVPALRFYGHAPGPASLGVVRCEKAGGPDLAQRLARLATAGPYPSLSPAFSRLLVMATGLCAFLYRVSGQSEILLAIPMANRPARFARTFGLLMSQLFLRVEVEPNETFISLAGKVRRAAYTAIPHLRHAVREKNLAYVTLNLLPNLPGDFAGIDAHFALDSSFTVPGPVIDAAGDERSRLGLQFSDFPENPLGISFDFHAATFDRAARDRVMVHFFRTLSALADNPETTLNRVNLMDGDERRQLLTEWNRTEADYPRDVPLAQLVEAQVERTPGAVAVVCGSESLSFADLNARANQLAHELRVHGAGPDRLVGICVERSVDMVVALLAVVKAGAAYLPLDPLLPQDRLNYMLEDSGASLVVLEERVRASLPAFSGTVVSLDDRGWKSNPRDDLAVAVQPDNLAYVIYTSGSTGKPKGVQVPRGALANLLWSMRDWLGLTAADRLLAVTTISFDIAGVDMWLPLLIGARLVVTSREEAADGGRLREQIDRHGITFLQATPVTWRLLLEAGWKGKSDLQIVCTGEAMPRDLAVALVPIVRRLWNLYGPTETTIWSTGYLVRDGKQPVLIGRPVANTQCYILDENRQPVPIGVVGELFIGGDGLARGYLGRPELTAEKFLPDPFRSQAGARMYRTGDLARYQADSNIECLGRTDHQVKIRGYRIELGEIEAAIARHPAVRQVVVVAREDVPSERRLVAYLVAESPPPDLVDQIRVLLRAALPEYMVPSHFVSLDAFPLTPSGKIDRKAFPPPNAQLTTAPSRGPRTTTEECLLGIWRNLLKRDGISIDDNFFDIGGHSLLAVTLVSEVKKQMGAQLPLSQALRSPTIAGLAESIDALLGSRPGISPPDSDALVEIKGGGPRCLFFVFDGFGEIIPYLTLARRMPPGYAVYGILPNRLPRIPLAHASIPEMAKHCVAQMRRRQPHGPYTIGGLCSGGVIAFAAAAQLEQNGERVDNVIILDAVAPKTRLRRWRVAVGRWERFSTALRRVWSPRNAQMPQDPEPTSASNSALSAVVQKVDNLVRYETRHLIESVSVAVRLRLLDHVLAKNRVWPQWIPSLSVPHILLRAQVLYNPARVGVPIVLVKAREGADSDLPSAELVTDPLLGWGDRTTGPLHVIDGVGGHSSMLQEPNVALIVERLTSLLDSAASDRSTPAKAVKSK